MSKQKYFIGWFGFIFGAVDEQVNFHLDLA